MPVNYVFVPTAFWNSRKVFRLTDRYIYPSLKTASPYTRIYSFRTCA